MTGMLLSILVAGLLALIWLAHAAPVQYPVSDIAVTELYTRLAGRGELLVGPYSRYSWHHPGPFYFYVLWPFYAMSGGHTAGLSVGAWAIYSASLGVASAAIWRMRWGTLPLLFALAMTGVTVRFPGLSVSPWNPHVIVMPMVALIVCTAAVIGGHIEFIVGVALAFSLVAQTHVSVALPGALMMAASLIAASVGMVSADVTRRRRSALLVGVTSIVLLVAWVPPILEQYLARQGNLAALWRYFARPPHVHQSVQYALRTAADAFFGLFRPAFGLARGALVAGSDMALLAVALLGLVAVLTFVAFNTRRTTPLSVRALSLLTAATVVTTAWSLTRVDDQIYDHVVFWLCGIGAVALVIAAHLALEPLLAKARSWHSAANLIGVVTCVCVCVLVGIRETETVMHALEVSPESQTIKALSRATVEYLRTNKHKPLILVPQDRWEQTAGLVVELNRAGMRFAVETPWLDMFTNRLSPDGSESVSLVIVQANDAGADAVVARSNEVVVVERTLSAQ